ncbi:MAG: hypothetical protein MZV64_15345 [Ignavibacteriales bacterium]|nr:hypothetical protein [Ignavibacteriales bacterium]
MLALPPACHSPRGATAGQASGIGEGQSRRSCGRRAAIRTTAKADPLAPLQRATFLMFNSGQTTCRPVR